MKASERICVLCGHEIRINETGAVIHKKAQGFLCGKRSLTKDELFKHLELAAKNRKPKRGSK